MTVADKHQANANVMIILLVEVRKDSRLEVRKGDGINSQIA